MIVTMPGPGTPGPDITMPAQHDQDPDDHDRDPVQDVALLVARLSLLKLDQELGAVVLGGHRCRA